MSASGTEELNFVGKRQRDRASTDDFSEEGRSIRSRTGEVVSTEPMDQYQLSLERSILHVLSDNPEASAEYILVTVGEPISIEYVDEVIREASAGTWMPGAIASYLDKHVSSESLEDDSSITGLIEYALANKMFGVGLTRNDILSRLKIWYEFCVIPNVSRARFRSYFALPQGRPCYDNGNGYWTLSYSQKRLYYNSLATRSFA